MAVGQSIGVLPVCFMIGGPRIALIAIGIVVLSVLIVMFRRNTTMSTAQPRPRHFVMAAASAAFHGGVTGYLWLAIYFILAGVAWLLRAIFGWPDVPDVLAAVARPSTYAAVPFFVGSLALTFRELTEQLYPDRAGVQPVFETAAISQRLLWTFTGIVLTGGVVLVAAAALNYEMSWIPATVLMVGLLSASAPLATLSSTEKRPVVREVTDATRRVLENAGYEVLQAPRTGDASVDPLLADLSLYVRAPGRGCFAIDIKASTTGQPLDWSAASSLKLKVSALTNVELNQRGDQPGGGMTEPITPVLVTLTPADDTLRFFAKDHHMLLFELAPPVTSTATETTSATGVGFVNVADNATIRSAAQNVPELIRALIAERATVIEG